MRSHIGWREERNIPYKGVETSPSRCVLIVRLTVIRNGSKQTIFANGGLGLLQGVRTERCASEIPYWLERGSKHSS